MLINNEKEKCCGCYACYNICKYGAITMVKDEKGFEYPQIDKTRCVNCGICEKVCPIINNQNTSNSVKAYACINKNTQERLESSSGGVFSLIAEKILNKNGVVFGASFDNEYNVEHIYIDKKEELYKLRGSKYVQSKIGNSYKKVKEFLEKDLYVLFTGTPCQIEGLLKYLQKDYEKLYTQDIICHGVPSPKVWQKYLEYRYKKDKNKPKRIYFRNKDDGWTLFNMKFCYDKFYYKQNQKRDLFMQAFLKNTILRDSCYNCRFKKMNRLSDITLADFWGIKNVIPEMYDNKGTSLVIINSIKGNNLFSEIKNNMKIKEVSVDEGIKFNSAMISSVKKDVKREEFFQNLETMSFDKLVKKYTTKSSIIKRVTNKILRILKIKK